MNWFKKLEMRVVEFLTWRPVGDWYAAERPVRVEEPPFVPFDLTPLRTAQPGSRPTVVAVAPPATREPATLTELGVPEELAQKFEATFRAMGATARGQVVGYRFRTPDGATRPIRLDEAA